MPLSPVRSTVEAGLAAIFCSSARIAVMAALLGVGDVAVYDGSLTEWAADPALPLVTGEA